MYKVHALKKVYVHSFGQQQAEALAMCEKKVGSACARVLTHLTCSHFPTAAILDQVGRVEGWCL